MSIVQPRGGHRTGSDAVLLAAAVKARGGERVLDVGSGVGVAGLCLLARVPGLEMTAVEIDAKLCALAANNAELNGFATSFTIVNADVTAAANSLRETGLVREGYRQIIANPPFHTQGSVRAAPDQARATAHVMGQGGLSAWLKFCTSYASPKGQLTLIHRAECLGELLALFERRFGDITVFPLFPKLGDPATRIILQARKGSRGGVGLLQGLVLHEADGRYTEAAESVLRGGAALPLD
ncbi:MAG: methyltransferase [Methyloceanibacter sp.]